MHELSIAQEIVDITVKSVPPEDYQRVKSIKIQLGEFSNIIPDSLAFCFNSIVDSSPVPNSRLVIEIIPLTVHCRTCDSELSINSSDFSCSRCGGTDIKIITGMELFIKEIELEDEIKVKS